VSLGPEGAASLRFFLDQGLGGLIQDIPGIIRNGRLKIGVNDVGVAIFFKGAEGHYTSYVQRRLQLRADMVGFVSPKLLSCFDPPEHIMEVPVFVHFEGNYFAFVYQMEGTQGVLS
jgi:hypothetical protein